MLPYADVKYQSAAKSLKFVPLGVATVRLYLKIIGYVKQEVKLPPKKIFKAIFQNTFDMVHPGM